MMLRALDFGASVAQLVEQLTLNQLVVGSNPPRGTTFTRGLFIFRFLQIHAVIQKKSNWVMCD